MLCDHASNDLKGFKVNGEEEGLVRSNDGWDPGAADLANYISEETNSMALMTNFSKLLIDPSVPICSDKLVRLSYRSQPELPVSFNG